MERIFENVNKKNSYWLGFIAADGYIYKDRLLGIGLSKRDIKHLTKFKKFIGIDNKISEMCKTNSVSYRITDKEVCEDLKKFGIVNRKSYKNISFIKNIPDEYRDIFIAGLFDGDGSIFRYKQTPKPYKGKIYEEKEYIRITIDSNEKTIDDIIEHLKKNYNFRKLNKTVHSSIFRLSWCSRHDIEQFLLLYDKSKIQLERKKEEVIKCKQLLQNMKGRKGRNLYVTVDK